MAELVAELDVMILKKQKNNLDEKTKVPKFAF